MFEQMELVQYTLANFITQIKKMETVRFNFASVKFTKQCLLSIVIAAMNCKSLIYVN